MVRVFLDKGAYAAPQCETAEEVLKDLLCESPNGETEDVGEISNFEW